MKFTIIREEEFDRTIQSLLTNFSKLEEFDNMVDWYISRDADNENVAYRFSGEVGEERVCYVWQTSDFSVDLPHLAIWYTINFYTMTVTLEGVNTVQHITDNFIEPSSSTNQIG